MLIVDGIRYKPWTPTDEEKEFHPLVKSQSKEIFGKDTIYFDVKTKLRTASGIGSIPDAYVIDLAEPYSWYIVENELSTHPVYDHIVPQLSKFLKGIENRGTLNQLFELLYEEISKDSSLRSSILAKAKTDEIYPFLSKLLIKSPKVVIVIDEKRPELEEAFDNFKITPQIVEFKTFVSENNPQVYAHLFQPINSEDEDAVVGSECQYQTKNSEEIDVIFSMLGQEIEKLSNDISKVATKTRVKYKTKKGLFVGVQRLDNRVRLHLYFKRKPDNSDHEHLSIRNQSEAESAIELIKKAYASLN
jgi:predicted transport protein